MNDSVVWCTKPTLQQWRHFRGPPPPLCPSCPPSGCLDMDTQVRFENASNESIEGDTGSDSEGGPWSSSSATKRSTGSEGAGTGTRSEGGDSPRISNMETTAAHEECAPPAAAEPIFLTPYNASRLRNIEMNNTKLEDLGLPAVVSQVGGTEKAQRERRPSEAGVGLLEVQSGEDLVRRVTRSKGAASPMPLRHQSRTEVRLGIQLCCHA